MLGHGSVLRLHLSEAAQGAYTCEAAVPGFPKVATSYQVSLRGPPEIEAAEEEKLAEVGASTTVACEVRNQGPASWSRGGVASASTVTWSHEGRVIRPDNGNFSILDTFDGDILRSVVLIKNVELHHFGQFECRAKNKFGSNHAVVTLSEHGSKYF